MAVPRLSAPVYDGASVISSRIEREINKSLRALYKSGGSQVAVVTLPTLQGEPIESTTLRFAETWKLGNEKKDNGVILLLAIQDRKMRIEVGQGNEGSLTDVQSKRILSDLMTPYLKQQQYNEAVVIGLSAIVQATDPQFPFAKTLVGAKDQRPVQKKQRSWVVTLIYVLLFLFFLGGGRGTMAGFLLGAALGGGRGGGFGGGGGFRGGGGGFSGGGASGSW